MTLTEKILARASGKARVQAGDNIWVNADVLMTHDVCGPGTIGVFKREFGKTAKVWDKVPETMHFRLEGKMQPGVMAKDIILHCIGEIGFDGATYRAMQFDGPGAQNLSIDDRMTVANMAIEAGGKNGIFEFDNQTKAFVDYRCKLNGTRSTYEPVERDR